jgi:hypothetical protein
MEQLGVSPFKMPITCRRSPGSLKRISVIESWTKCRGLPAAFWTFFEMQIGFFKHRFNAANPLTLAASIGRGATENRLTRRRHDFLFSRFSPKGLSIAGLAEDLD